MSLIWTQNIEEGNTSCCYHTATDIPCGTQSLNKVFLLNNFMIFGANRPSSSFANCSRINVMMTNYRSILYIGSNTSCTIFSESYYDDFRIWNCVSLKCFEVKQNRTLTWKNCVKLSYSIFLHVLDNIYRYFQIRDHAWFK